VVPNPVTTSCSVSLPDEPSETIASWRVIDITGRVVPVSATTRVDRISFDLTGLAGGMYIFMATDARGSRYVARIRKL
jgi:hypothetical protein